MMPLKHVDGLSALSDQYDTFLFDVWGVLHNGQQLFPDVLKVFKNLRHKSKEILLLSNAPRLVPHMQERLRQLGLDDDLYDGAYTSGEDVHYAFQSGLYKNFGETFAYLGTTPKHTPLTGLPFTQVSSLEDAAFILNTGPDAVANPALDSFTSWLSSAVAHSLPMICANPDLYVMVGATKAICAGAVAKLYEEMGGVVHYHGKPYPRMYERLFERFEIVDRSRVLAFGDSFATDIRGANQMGIDCVFMESGIYGDQVRGDAREEAYLRFMEEYTCHPTYVMPMLTW